MSVVVLEHLYVICSLILECKICHKEPRLLNVSRKKGCGDYNEFV